MDRFLDIEKSIIKRFRKEIWGKFVKAVQDYELIKENDNIMVCISGGKDSFLMAKCIEELIKHGKFPFKAHYVVMDPGYNEVNRNKIEENAKILNVPIEIFESDIFNVVDRVAFKNPCYMCARMRRGFLYAKAKELGCNKIALAHHFDDVIETTLLSMFYAGEIKTMVPKLHSENFEGLELIRPMYLIHEENVISWAKYNKLNFINCACRFTENCTLNEEDDTTSKRREMKKLIKKMKEAYENADINVFRAMENVNLDCVLGFSKDGEKHNFLDEYND